MSDLSVAIIASTAAVIGVYALAMVLGRLVERWIR